jgi:hypothetical protein
MVMVALANLVEAVALEDAVEVENKVAHMVVAVDRVAIHAMSINKVVMVAAVQFVLFIPDPFVNSHQLV